jgi:hypothetical protein
MSHEEAGPASLIIGPERLASVGVALQPIVEPTGALLGVRPGEDHDVAPAITIAVNFFDAPLLRPGVGIMGNEELSHAGIW